MRKLAPARVSYRHDFLISYRVYMMTGLFHISSFEGTPISTQSSSAHVKERDQELWGTLEQDCL